MSEQPAVRCIVHLYGGCPTTREAYDAGRASMTAARMSSGSSPRSARSRADRGRLSHRAPASAGAKPAPRCGGRRRTG